MKNRNQPCPCGSGKKRKRCCGDDAPNDALDAPKEVIDGARRRFAHEQLCVEQEIYRALLLRDGSDDAMPNRSAFYSMPSDTPLMTYANTSTTADCTMESLAETIKKLKETLPKIDEWPMYGPSAFEKVMPLLFTHEYRESITQMRFQYEYRPIVYDWRSAFPVISVDGPPALAGWPLLRSRIRTKLRIIRFLWQNRFRDYRRPHEPMGFWF